MKPKRILKIMAAICCISVVANATPITYIFEGIGSGDVDGVVFQDAPFVITMLADTDFIYTPVPNVLAVNDISSGIEIAGFLPGDFLTPKTLLVNNSQDQLSFALPTGVNLLGLPPNPAFSTYDLGVTGPILSPTALVAGYFNAQATTTGAVTIADAHDITFVAIPEPASMAMIALFTGGLYFTRRFFPAV